ncbi:MAG: hypothetical protein AAGG68_02330 [Bacteroidota bacterium]
MLKKRFLDLIGNYSNDLSFNMECWEEIAAHYCSKPRHYHNLQHLEDMLQELETVKQDVQEMDSILFSIFYHDIIYKATQSDNEYQSALLFKKRISKTNFEHIEYCFQQIEATKMHQLSEDRDTNFLIDIDLAVLGQEWKTYEEYCQQIRREYRIYPNFMYRKGRKKVLEKILGQDQLYKTPYFFARYEAQARKNMEREVLQLR